MALRSWQDVMNNKDDDEKEKKSFKLKSWDVVFAPPPPPPADEEGWRMLKGDSPPPPPLPPVTPDSMRMVKGDIGMPPPTPIDLTTPDMQAKIGRGEVFGALNDNRSFLEKMVDGFKEFGGSSREVFDYFTQGASKTTGLNDAMDAVLKKSGGFANPSYSIADADRKPEDSRWLGNNTAKNWETAGEVTGTVAPYLVGSPLFNIGKKAALTGVTKLAPKVAESLASRGALGLAGDLAGGALLDGTVTTGLETLKGLARPEEFDLGDAAKNVAINSAIGAVGGVVGDVAIRGISNLGRNILGNLGRNVEDIFSPTKASVENSVGNTGNIFDEIMNASNTKQPKQYRTVDFDAQQKAVNDFEQGVEQVRNYIKHDDILAAYPEGTTIKDAFADIKTNTGVDLEHLASQLDVKPKPLSQQLEQAAEVSRMGRVAGAVDSQPINPNRERVAKAPETNDLKVGDTAIPTSADGTHLSNAARITDVQTQNGTKYYQFEGSTTYMPEKQVIRSTQQTANTVNTPEGVQGMAQQSIPLRKAATQADDTISRNQVVKNMRKNLGVTIDTGRLSGKGNIGEYKVTPEVIRSKQQADIQVISHEIGHHLDKKYGLSNPQYANELVNMTNTSNPNHLSNYKPNQHLEESIAEYVRLRLTDPQQAKRLAPNFTKFFDEILDKKTLKGLQKTADDIDTWITQGDFNRAVGAIDFQDKLTVVEKIQKQKWSFNKFYREWVDDLHPLKVVEKILTGKVAIGKNSMYKLARNSRGVAEKAKLAITRGFYDQQGNKTGKGLMEIVEPLEKLGVSEKDFSTYVVVKHELDLKALGKKVTHTDDEINAVLKKMDTPELQKIQQEVVQFNNNLLEVLVDAQVLSREAVTKMRKVHPNYVPFLRYFDDDAIAGFKNGGFGATKGFANITNPVKRMSEEGSERTIINPFESMVKNTFLVMNSAAKNRVGLQLAELSKIDGAGAWVERLAQGGRSAKEHILTVFENGKPIQYKLRDPELYNAMLSLDHESTNSLLRFLGGVAGILRAGATLTPEFIVRNPMRDVVGATINSTKYGFNPMDFFKGMYHVIGKTKEFDQFLSSGGAYSTLMALDRDASKEALQKVFKTTLKNRSMNLITDPKQLALEIGKFATLYTPAKATIRTLRKMSEATELATKVGAFTKASKKSGDLDEAAYIARDLMDFNRAGSNIRQANRAIAFLNASIQGTDRMARAFKDNPASFMTRAFVTLVLPSIGLYYWNANLPEEQKKVYDNIPQWQKNSFFIIGIPGTETFLRIPKPFEVGTIFATGTERVMQWYMENDPEAFKGYGKAVLEAFTPPVMISALTPIIEAITNHSFFKNMDIVPLGEQRLMKQDQAGVNTSETAKLLGQLLGDTALGDTNFASPRIIDNTIKGYTAGLGQYAVSGLDAIINQLSGKEKVPQAEKDFANVPAPLQPMVKAFTATTSGGGQVRTDFYDRWNEVSHEKESADKKKERYPNLAEYNRLKKAKSSVDKLNEQYKKIQNHPKMDSKEKREMLDSLDERINKLVESTLNKK